MRPILFALLIALTGLAAGPVLSHELWIAPARYTVEPNNQIIAHIRVGERFEGTSQVYLTGNFKRFDVIMNGKVTKVEGRLGDDPALQMTAPDTGLAVIVYQTTKDHVRYQKWEKFEAFTRHKNFSEILQQHTKRGLPRGDFVERYFRHAKSLVAVGHGRGADMELGLETEFVAEANPYTDPIETGLPVRLLYQGRPRAFAQVEVFEKAPSGTVKVRLLTTDANGRVTLSTKADHEYLLDAVIARPLEAKDPKSDPVWETLWAQFTFRTPP